jgi:hypothetical protein
VLHSHSIDSSSSSLNLNGTSFLVKLTSDHAISAKSLINILTTPHVPRKAQTSVSDIRIGQDTIF